jgi:hypothetical protein
VPGFDGVFGGHVCPFLRCAFDATSIEFREIT